MAERLNRRRVFDRLYISFYAAPSFSVLDTPSNHVDSITLNKTAVKPLRFLVVDQFEIIKVFHGYADIQTIFGADLQNRATCEIFHK